MCVFSQALQQWWPEPRAALPRLAHRTPQPCMQRVRKKPGGGEDLCRGPGSQGKAWDRLDGYSYLPASQTPPSLFTKQSQRLSNLCLKSDDTQSERTKQEGSVTDRISVGLWCWRLLPLSLRKQSLVNYKVLKIGFNLEPVTCQLQWVR